MRAPRARAAVRLPVRLPLLAGRGRVSECAGACRWRPPTRPSSTTLQRGRPDPGGGRAAIVAAALDTVRDRPDTHAQDRTTRPDRARPGDHRAQRLTDALAAGTGVRVGAGGARRPGNAAGASSGPPGAPGRAPARATLDPETLAGSHPGPAHGLAGALERHPAQARQILRKLLVGRLRFTPEVDADGWPGTRSRARPPTGVCWPASFRGQTNGAGRGNRTPTPLRAPDFESGARGRPRVSIGHDRRNHRDFGVLGDGRRARWSLSPLDGSGTEVTQSIGARDRPWPPSRLAAPSPGPAGSSRSRRCRRSRARPLDQQSSEPPQVRVGIHGAAPPVRQECAGMQSPGSSSWLTAALRGLTVPGVAATSAPGP